MMSSSATAWVIVIHLCGSYRREACGALSASASKIFWNVCERRQYLLTRVLLVAYFVITPKAHTHDGCWWSNKPLRARWEKWFAGEFYMYARTRTKYIRICVCIYSALQTARENRTPHSVGAQCAQEREANRNFHLSTRKRLRGGRREVRWNSLCRWWHALERYCIIPGLYTT
jgi:hypothetical protein